MSDGASSLVALALGALLLSWLARPLRRTVSRLGLSRTHAAVVVTTTPLAAVLLLLLALSASSVSLAETLTVRSGTFDIANAWTALTDSPVTVPTGAQGLQVLLQEGRLTSGDGSHNGYQVSVSCQPHGGGSPQVSTSGARLYWLPQPATMLSIDVTSCASVMVSHHNWGDSYFVGSARVTVVASFYGASLPGPTVASEAFKTDWSRFGTDAFMATGGDPVQTLTGNFAYSRADVVIPGRGPTPSFVRTYNSLDDREGPLGPGWTHQYTARIRKPDGDTAGALLLVGPQGRQDRYTIDSVSGLYTPPAGVTTRLIRNADLTFTATHKDNSVWRFDANGRLTDIRDRHGNQSTLTYDANGRLATIGDPAGRGSLTLTYDANGRLSTVSDWLSPARVVAFSYDSNTPSRLKTVTDRAGKVTTYGYEGTSQRLTTIVDDNGHVAMTQTYDGQGRVATQKDARGLLTGQQTTFSYVTNGDGTKTTTVTAPATSYQPAWTPSVADTYDTQGRIVRRVVKPTSSSADDVVTAYTYDANSNLATATDGRGSTTTYCYDVGETGQPIQGSWRNLTRRIDPAPTSGGNVLVTLFAYDLHDNLVRTIPPKGVSSSASTTCTTDLSSSVNLTYATTLTYDAAGMKLLATTRSYTDPDTSSTVTAKTTFEYDPSQPGLVSSVTPPRGNTTGTPDRSYATQFTYFGAGSKHGLLQSVTDALGHVTTFDYDAVGRRTSLVDPTGQTWAYEYDNENRLRFARAPAPTSTSTQLVTESRYDGAGNLTTLIDANGQVTRYLYDERDSLREVWESPSPWTDPFITPSPKYVTAYQYDQNGNLSRVTRAAGDPTAERIVEYTYDGLNRVRTETQYAGPGSTSGPLVMQTSYDANGNRATVTDQLNRTTTFSYDRLNRLTGIDYADPGTPDVSYTYDANGSRLTMTDGSGQTTYSYDELGRLLSVTTPSTPSSKTVGYRYDRDGNRTTLLYPTGEAVTYAFDKASRLTTATDWATRVTSYAYFPDGALQTQTNWNGTVSEYRYDQARRLTEVWNKPSASATDAITRHTFSLDNVGNRTRIDETLAPLAPSTLQPAPSGLPTGHPMTPTTAPSGLPTGHPMTASTAPTGLPNHPAPSASPTTQTLTYEYDRLYRLTSASGGPVGATSYSYDPVGNRLTRTRGSVTTTYSYDRADRITSATSPSGGTSYTVDAVGNLTLRGPDTLSYDQANRLTGIDFSSPSTPDAAYRYDGDGKRVSKTIGTGPGATTTSYLYDVNRGLPVLLEDGTRRYVWGLGLAYEVEGSAALVYHTDGLGSVRAITDSTKAVVQTYESDEFGVPIMAQGGVSQPFGFTGEQRDPESGLVYLRARLYEPMHGRFAQRDRLAGDAVRPRTLHRYAYAYNSPCNFTDASGLKPSLLRQQPPIPSEAMGETIGNCGVSTLAISDAGSGLLGWSVAFSSSAGPLLAVQFNLDVINWDSGQMRSIFPAGQGGSLLRTPSPHYYESDQSYVGEGVISVRLTGMAITAEGFRCLIIPQTLMIRVSGVGINPIT